MATVLDRVAVVVGQDVITEGEVMDELRLSEFLASKPLDVGPAQRYAAAQRLVDQQLIRNEMMVANYSPPSANESENMLREFRQEHYPGEAEFRMALQQYGITEDQVKKYLLWQLTAIRFTDDRFKTQIPGNPEQTANRLAPGSTAPAREASVDDQLDAWLKEARATTRIVFKKEAFQ
jgi:hypothetical protein